MFTSTHPFWGPSSASVAEYPTNPANSDVSTADTLEIMASLSREHGLRPELVALSRYIASGCSNCREALQAIWYWVHSNIQFRRHEEIVLDVFGPHHAGIESQLLIPPADLLRLPRPQGDCAIFSMLTASLMLSLEMEAALRATASDAEEPERWSHVYVIGVCDGEVFPMDTSHGKYPGWETDKRYRVMDYVL